MTKIRKSKETERSKYWRHVVKEWETSGMTQAAFCRERDLSSAAFSWWRREFKKRDSKTKAGIQSTKPSKNSESHGLQFVQVSGLEKIAPFHPQDRIEIILANGHQIRVPHEFSSETLQRVLKVLESVC